MGDKRTPSLHLTMSSQKCSHNPYWQIIHYQGTWGVTKTHILQLLTRKHACLPFSSIALFGQTNFIHQKRLLPVRLTNGQISCHGTTPSILDSGWVKAGWMCTEPHFKAVSSTLWIPVFTKFRLAEMCTYEERVFHHSPAMAVFLLWKVAGSSTFFTCIFSLELRSQVGL